MPSDPYNEVHTRVRQEISRHFKVTLGRPEILNRTGENIIVFDYIRQPVGEEIFAASLGRLLTRVYEAQGVTVELEPEATSGLQSICLADLTNGGRGIRNQLEAHFVNPLTRVLFDATLPTGSTVKITGIRQGAVTELDWEAC